MEKPKLEEYKTFEDEDLEGHKYISINLDKDIKLFRKDQLLERINSLIYKLYEELPLSKFTISRDYIKEYFEEILKE